LSLAVSLSSFLLFLTFWSLCLMASAQHLALINILQELLNNRGTLLCFWTFKGKKTVKLLIKAYTEDDSWLGKLSEINDREIKADSTQEFLWNIVCVYCVCVYMCVWGCVCVWERERKRKTFISFMEVKAYTLPKYSHGKWINSIYLIIKTFW
jgi:hypothetical protein